MPGKPCRANRFFKRLRRMGGRKQQGKAASQETAPPSDQSTDHSNSDASPIPTIHLKPTRGSIPTSSTSKVKNASKSKLRKSRTTDDKESLQLYLARAESAYDRLTLPQKVTPRRTQEDDFFSTSIISTITMDPAISGRPDLGHQHNLGLVDGVSCLSITDNDYDDDGSETKSHYTARDGTMLSPIAKTRMFQV